MGKFGTLQMEMIGTSPYNISDSINEYTSRILEEYSFMHGKVSNIGGFTNLI